jgi:hypothetical protein
VLFQPVLMGRPRQVETTTDDDHSHLSQAAE